MMEIIPPNRIVPIYIDDYKPAGGMFSSPNPYHICNDYYGWNKIIEHNHPKNCH